MFLAMSRNGLLREKSQSFLDWQHQRIRTPERYTRCPVVGVGTGLCGDLGEVLPTPPAFPPPPTEPLSLPEDALPPFILGPKVVKAETARLGELAQIGPSTAAVGDDDVCGTPFWRWWWCWCWRRMAAWSMYAYYK